MSKFWCEVPTNKYEMPCGLPAIFALCPKDADVAKGRVLTCGMHLTKALMRINSPKGYGVIHVRQ